MTMLSRSTIPSGASNTRIRKAVTRQKPATRKTEHASARGHWPRIRKAMGPKRPNCHEKPCLTKRVWLFLVKWIFMVRGAERERELVASMPQRAMCIASQ
ncbi:hypothetical protein D3C85_1496410 [compost metagenome]